MYTYVSLYVYVCRFVAVCVANCYFYSLENLFIDFFADFDHEQGH